ncbi:MAG: hypothetical protein R3F45_01355 [Gammaproteobacteria bacterium]
MAVERTLTTRPVNATDKIAAITDMSNGGSICLLSCYLPNQIHLDVVLELLDRHLAERGVTLIVLTTYRPAHDRFRYLQIPHLLADYSELAVPPDQAALSRYPHGYLDADALWQCVKEPHAGTVRGLAVCDPLSPGAGDPWPDSVFIWNPTVPAGRLLQPLCATYTIPGLNNAACIPTR